jgi:hypothetical protein
VSFHGCLTWRGPGGAESAILKNEIKIAPIAGRKDGRCFFTGALGEVLLDIIVGVYLGPGGLISCDKCHHTGDNERA